PAHATLARHDALPISAEAVAGDVTPARCMGRSRGGLTTKIHAVVDANGNPIALKLTEGQAHDGRSAADLLDSLGANQILLADRGDRKSTRLNSSHVTI